jgi:hypothetical protein
MRQDRQEKKLRDFLAFCVADKPAIRQTRLPVFGFGNILNIRYGGMSRFH